jgi:putative transposase
VRARLVACAQDWAWSSARAHLAGRDVALVRVAPLLDRVGRFCDLIDGDGHREAFAALRAAESTGRALGSSEFVARIERLTGRRLRPQTPGRKPSARTDQLELQIPGMSSEE